MDTDRYFDHQTDIGIIGRGVTVETCFTDAARVMFSLMTDLSEVHLTQIISFEFEEEDLSRALVTWLNLLLSKAKEHQLVCGDFRLKRDGNHWKATVSGERWRAGMSPGTEVKEATTTMLSIKKMAHAWEVRCVIDCQPIRTSTKLKNK